MDGRSLVAWNLKRLRSQLGVAQERLAADAEVDRAHVSNIERRVTNATVDLLDRLATALNVPMSEFFRMPAPHTKPPKPLQAGRKQSSKGK